MYHEEKIIDGILCWRKTPTGAWIRFNSAELTARLVLKTRQYEELRALMGQDDNE